MITISIVNRFYPPDAAVTGVAAAELAEFLRRQLPQAQVRIFATRARYAGGQATQAGSVDVERIRSWYDGTRKLPRLLASLLEGLQLALRATRGADVVISLTDPPLLGFWIGLMRRVRRFRWIDWTMDLYPEAFVAAGLVTPRNPVYRLLRAAVRRALPDRYLALGPQQAAWLQAQRGAVPAFILPCGISAQIPGPVPQWRRDHAQAVVVAYAGNLGEAHSEAILIELVRRADPARVRFLLALYGAKAERTRAALSSFGHVMWRDKIAHAELAHADVHLATLKPEWTHVCVPSKAVSSVCLGRPLLLAGSTDADNWVLLQRAAWLVPEHADGRFDATAIDAALAAIGDASVLADRTAQAVVLRAELLQLRDRTLHEVAGWIAGPSPA